MGAFILVTVIIPAERRDSEPAAGLAANSKTLRRSRKADQSSGLSSCDVDEREKIEDLKIVRRLWVSLLFFWGVLF